MSSKLIDLERLLSDSKWSFFARRPLVSLVESGLGFAEVNRIHAEVDAQLEGAEAGDSFFMRTLRVMGVHFELEQGDFERIPREGRLIVVANHPFGGIDGVVLGALLKRVRPDAKLMGNYLLAKMKGIRESIIEVDPFGNSASSAANLRGMRSTLRFLKGGGCLGAFPSGEVSSLRLKTGGVADPIWSTHLVNLAIKTRSPVLPLYFEGCNSRFFQCAGLVHPRVRTALLAREFSKACGRKIPIKLGPLIDPNDLESFGSVQAATDFIRLKTYSLGDPAVKRSPKRLRLPFRGSLKDDAIEPLALAESGRALAQEVDHLPPGRRLAAHGDFEVFYAGAEEIPTVLREIGRLREATFRAVGEGTGRAADLDKFDRYYLHLFLWNRAAEEIVGAYRIGLVDSIIKSRGKQGLYTSTLFDYGPQFLDKLGPAMELGRSFIRAEYQKKHASLALIWRGIGAFVVRNPQYRTLFGPVSITDEYNKISKDLMVHYFREHAYDEEMARHVRPRNAPKSFDSFKGVSLKQMGASIQSLDSISAIVSGFEKDNKGVPILLRHYLRLNGVLLNFNVDPAFNDVIDGLILVDLCKADPNILQRYMDKQGHGEFMKFHGFGPDVADS